MRTQLTNGVMFDQDHYRKVMRAREEKGLPTHQDFIESDDRLKSGEIPNHPLLGKEFEFCDEDGVTIYIVECVCKQWYNGWYLMCTPRQKGTKSHSVMYIENIDCRNPWIIEGIEEFQQKVKWL